MSTLEERTLDHIDKLFSYRPAADETWCVYYGLLIVCHPERKPRMYRHKGGGVATEIVDTYVAP